MIGADTNVLVRFLTNDDPQQSPIARRILSARTPADPLFISLPVLIETLWVLQSGYKYPAAGSRELVANMLALDNVEVQHSALVDRAIQIAEKAKVDLPDVLIALINEDAGCSHTVTFDKGAAKIPGMKPAK